jgi:hypothetical protein
MKIRKVALAGVAVLLAGVALAVPGSASAALPPFTCGTQSFFNPDNASNLITAVKVGRHDSESPAYDRFVVEFEGATVPSWTATPKSSAYFTLAPSNQQVKLAGNAGIRLDLHPHITPAYKGQTDFVTGFPQLAEARELQDFDGVVWWGLGLNHQSCKRIFTLSGPTRLVVDVPH